MNPSQSRGGNSWYYYSPDHGQLCQDIEVQTLWGEMTCRVCLAGADHEESY